MSGQKDKRLRRDLFYLFALSEWQAAPTLANSLAQLDNTLQPTAGESERERLIIQSLCSLQIALCRSWTISDKHGCRVRGHCVGLAGQNRHRTETVEAWYHLVILGPGWTCYMCWGGHQSLGNGCWRWSCLWRRPGRENILLVQFNPTPSGRIMLIDVIILKAKTKTPSAT